TGRDAHRREPLRRAGLVSARPGTRPGLRVELMDKLGTFCLALALALALYGLIAAIWGVRKGRPLFVESARTATYGVLAAVAAANGAMIAALLSHDFHLAYVAEDSSRETPTLLKVLALWSAD